MRNKNLRLAPAWVAILVALIFVMAGTAQAQSGRGSISGLVKDESNAVVPGVTVEATNQGTNIVTTTTTNAQGLYSVQNLPIGTYSVSFTLTGFRTYTREGITLSLGEPLNLDHTMIVGALEDEVTVTADTSMLGTGNAEVGTTMSSDIVQDLPLNISGGRSILNFAYAVTPSVEGEGKDNAWNSHVAGGMEFSNEVVLDGVSAVIQIGGWVGESSPPMEAIEEFKIQTSGIPAEYGRTAGGVFNYSLKSGTNEFHGSVFGALRNEGLNANTWQNNYLLETDPENAEEYERAEDRQYLGGFSLGGPIIKDKTFFFASFENFQQSRFVLGGFNATVPIAPFLDGDFSALLDTGTVLGLDAAGNPIYSGAIFDPLTGNVFPGNVIPSDRISNTSQQITDIYRQQYLPSIDRLTDNNARPQYNSPKFQQRQLAIKLTHQFDPNNQLSASFIHSFRPRTLVDAGGIWNANDPDKTGGPLARSRTQEVESPQVRVHYSRTFSPAVLNTINFSWARYINPSIALAADGGWPAQLGFADMGAGNFPTINFGSAVNGVETTRIGYGSGGRYTSDTFIVNDALSLVKGRHMFKFGGEFRYMKQTSKVATGTYTFNFDPATTGRVGEDWSNQVGFGFASFLLGEVDSASVVTEGTLTGSRDYFALYAQDDFRVNDKLTLNLGLRWEVTGPWSEHNGHWGNFNRELIDPEKGVPGLLEFAEDGSTTYEGPRDWGQFGPRLGVAYTPTERVVLRGAWGIFYQPVGMDYWAGTPYSFAPGYRGTNEVRSRGAGVPNFNWDGGYPGVEVPGTEDPNNIPWGPTTMSPRSLEGGRIQQWSAGVEFEATQDLVLGVNYLGNKGKNLHGGYLERNQPDMAALSALVQRGQEWNWVWDEASAADAGVPYPYPGYSNFSFMTLFPYAQVAQTWGPLFILGSPFGETSYHALQLTANKRKSQGFAGQVSYTYSRARGNIDTSFQEQWWTGPAQDVYDYDLEANAIQQFDRTHVLKGYLSWDLPFGEGRKWLNQGGLLDVLFGGWEMSLIFRYESGAPLRITSNNYIAGWSDVNSSPIYVNADPNGNYDVRFDGGGFDQSDPLATGNSYFDPSLFSNPAYGEFGEGPGWFEQLRGHFNAYEDFGLMKHFSIGNRVRAQLRLELINLFNRHYFANPVTNIGSPNFGYVISTAGTPRQGQVYLRFQF